MIRQLKYLVRRLNPHATLTRAWELKGGASIGMTAFEIAQPDGQTRKLILRQPSERRLNQNPRAAADEFKLLQNLQSISIPVQAPILLDDSRDIFPLPYLVIEFIDGGVDFLPANVQDVARQMAGQLARIHSINGENLELAFLPKQTTEIAPSPADQSPIERQIRAALQSMDVKQANPAGLLHGDFWAGNILWRNGELAAVIDWEDAAFGDPLEDFAISRLDMLLIFGRDALDEFTRHYLSLTALDLANLPYWDLRAALRAEPNLSAWSQFDPQFGRSDITVQTMREAHTWFVTHVSEQLSLRD
jgi:aminoglycoside phosphotransferase (APT) family kinase protein